MSVGLESVGYEIVVGTAMVAVGRLVARIGIGRGEIWESFQQDKKLR
uniref:Uncharacterized protein n=1 Tax=Ficus carica TaxID=3494 RepID=A0AA88JIE4_FICCA|nr:hypothetical protein TIFTF001_056617 [Ficus carica]